MSVTEGQALAGNSTAVEERAHHLPAHPPESASESRVERWLGVTALALVLAVGAGLRAWLALHDDGIYWPDEIYQSLEPAHRLVFGYGLQAWEFIAGARNWAFPGTIAVLLKLCTVIGLDRPWQYLAAIKLAFVGVGVATAYGSYRLARSYDASTLTAACGASIFALAAPAIYFAPRALSETGSALPVILGFALSLQPRAGRWTRVLGASLIGLAVLFRLQNAIFAVALLGILAGRRQWRPALEALATLLVWALVYGTLDRLTWGGWYQSALVYVQVNLLQGRAAQLGGGTEPFPYYFQYLWTSLGGALAAIVGVLAISAVRRAPGLVLTALAYVLIHSLIPHKELRFMLPVLPLFCALAGIGLDSLRLQEHRSSGGPAMFYRMVAAGVILAALASGLTFRSLRFGDIGAYLTSRPDISAYDDSGPTDRLLMAAYGQQDLCGLKIESVSLTWSGGYSYLHRNVPLYPNWGPPPESGLYNYVISIAGEKPPGQVVAVDHDDVLVRLAPQGCVPDPNYQGRV